MDILEIFEEICNGNFNQIDKFVLDLFEQYTNESLFSFEISNLEALPFTTNKRLVDKILSLYKYNTEFVETAVAQIGNKPIISLSAIEVIKDMI